MFTSILFKTNIFDEMEWLRPAFTDPRVGNSFFPRDAEMVEFLAPSTASTSTLIVQILVAISSYNPTCNRKDLLVP